MEFVRSSSLVVILYETEHRQLTSRLLQDARRQRICYAAAHMVVIQTEGVGPQTILQGHCQPVSCLATSSDRSFIASADVGPESLLVLWNAQTASPFWTVSRPHSHGVLAMDLSPRGRHLVTLSAVQSNTDEQQLAVWDISKPAQTPEFAATVPAGDPQIATAFNADGEQLLSNGRHTACFWQLTPAGVVLCSAPMGDSEFKHSPADLTTSAFLPDGVQVQTRLALLAAFSSHACYCAPDILTSCHADFPRGSIPHMLAHMQSSSLPGSTDCSDAPCMFSTHAAAHAAVNAATYPIQQSCHTAQGAISSHGLLVQPDHDVQPLLQLQKAAFSCANIIQHQTPISHAVPSGFLGISSATASEQRNSFEAAQQLRNIASMHILTTTRLQKCWGIESCWAADHSQHACDDCKASDIDLCFQARK